MKRTETLLYSALILTSMHSTAAGSVLNLSDSLSIDQSRNYTQRFFSDLPSCLPGMWERDFGSMNAGPFYRYRGSELNSIDISLDGILLRDPLNHQIDMNLLPWGDLKTPSLSNPISSTSTTLALQTHPLAVKKPASKVIYQNIIFRPDTRANQTYFDVSYQQPVRSNLAFSIGTSSNKYANDFPDSVLVDKQFRGHIEWSPFLNLSLSYGILSNDLSHNSVHPMRFPGDTITTNSGHLNQKRTDHFVVIGYDWKKLSSRCSYAYNRHHFTLKDRDLSTVETAHIASHGIDLSQSIRFNLTSLKWGFYYADDKADFMDTDASLSQQEHIIYAGLSAPFLRHFLFDAEAKQYANSFVDSEFLYNAKLTAAISDHWTWFFNQQKNVLPATLDERTGRTLTPYPADRISDCYAIMNHSAIHPNADLKNASSTGFETGIRFRHARLILEAAAYARKDHHVIALNTSDLDSLFYDNSEEKKVKGIEGQITLLLPFHLQFSSICNYFKGQDRSKNDLLEPPDLWGSAALSWGGVFFQGDLDALFSLSWQFNSQYYLPQILNDEIGIVSIDNHRFLNAKADLLFMQKARFTFSFENILNQQLTLIHYTLPLRTFRMGIEWELFN